MKNKNILRAFVALLVSFSTLFYSSISLSEETFFKPFILAQTIQSIDLNKTISETKTKLSSNGFEIVGEYAPYKDTHIIIISSPKLKQYASQSKNGIYGAIQRVSITVVDNNTQVAFTNPTYMAHVYRFKTDLADITQSLKASLGFEKEYGSDKGLTKSDLREYQYKIFMPDFTDRLELAEYPNQQEAITNVNKALENNEGGVSKLYQVSLDGKEETIIGVKLVENNISNCSSDKFIMGEIDFKKIKSTGHLPYEIIIQNGNVYALFAEFRIAISFPDLSMIGSNSFMSIMCAPDSIQKALTLGAGAEPDD